MSKYSTDDQATGLVPHLPSSWPDFKKCDAEFMAALQRIFYESILGEINNVIDDAQRSRGSLDNRGYVIMVALMCALDAISSYGYGDQTGAQIPDFIQAHFPRDYHPHAKLILRSYRNIGVHSWHLFAAGFTTGGSAITFLNGVPCINLLHFRDALAAAVANYFKQLTTDATLRSMTLRRYLKLRKQAKRAW